MLTQLLEFQKYLKTLFNRGKTIADQFKKMCPQNAKVACVYAFTKIQKGYMCLQSFKGIQSFTQPLTHTTLSCYYN